MPFDTVSVFSWKRHRLLPEKATLTCEVGRQMLEGMKALPRHRDMIEHMSYLVKKKLRNIEGY